MTYTSVSFLFFTLGCMLVYYCTPKQRRWCVLLAASMGFYAIVCRKYIAFILLTGATTYGGGIALGRYIDKTAYSNKTKRPGTRRRRTASRQKSPATRS